jgi:hypothetical protein
MTSIGLQIETSFKIEENTLTTFDNKQYKLLSFSNNLSAELAYKLKDPLLAENIFSAYIKYIQNTLTQSTESLFSNALTKVCYLFGSLKFSPEKALIQSLREEGFHVSEWLAVNWRL